MKEPVHQGDILKVEYIKSPVLVTSKDFFNQSGEVIGCPISKNGEAGALRIFVKAGSMDGYVHCEKLALLDLRARGYSKIDHIHMPDIMNITDAIQAIFDYV